MSAAFIPPSWDTPERKPIVIEFIAHLPIDPEDRKKLLADWAARAGVTLTAQDYRDAKAHVEASS